MKKEIVLKFNGEKFVEVYELLTIYWKDTFIIPRGFKTDLASIPRPLWWFIAPTDWFILVPAVLHDYLYRYTLLPRKECDRAFLDKMRDFDRRVVVRRYLAWLAVRLFAGKIYAKYSKSC